MAGGTIFKKDPINGAFQGGEDKSLVINPNYAYIAPWTFESSWNEIQLGVFISFVKTGDGNENIGFDSNASNDSFTEKLGATANDEFFYFGIGRTGEEQSLPLSAENSGFLGFRADAINFRANTSALHNHLINVSESDGSLGDPNLKFFSSSGASFLEESDDFDDHRGNWVCIGLNSGAVNEGPQSNANATGCTEHSERFFSYWGLRFRTINKGSSAQQINFTAQAFGAGLGDNATGPNIVNAALSDPSTGTLSNLLDSANVKSFNDPTASTSNYPGRSLMASNAGFKYNNGSTALSLPNALYIYNGFSTVRPRIHAWGVKVIS